MFLNQLGSCILVFDTREKTHCAGQRAHAADSLTGHNPRHRCGAAGKNTMGGGVRSCAFALDGNGRRDRGCHDDVRLQADQLLRERSYPIDVIAVLPKVYPRVAPNGPTQVRKRLRERRVTRLRDGLVFRRTA
jgi:hypothetical protein